MEERARAVKQEGRERKIIGINSPEVSATKHLK
jgi:hypothetical protein